MLLLSAAPVAAQQTPPPADAAPPEADAEEEADVEEVVVIGRRERGAVAGVGDRTGGEGVRDGQAGGAQAGGDDADRVGAQLGPRNVEQRPDDGSGSWPHAGETRRPGAPNQPQQERLRLVLETVADGDRRGLERGRRPGQKRVARDAGLVGIWIDRPGGRRHVISDAEIAAADVTTIASPDELPALLGISVGTPATRA